MTVVIPKSDYQPACYTLLELRKPALSNCVKEEHQFCTKSVYRSPAYVKKKFKKLCIPYFQFKCVKVYLLGKTWTLHMDNLNSKSVNFTINTAADLTD